ncbi:MAG: hypothetical protein J6C13_00965 [Clostridia bacterium]|nr:hypothetical protein [Clostridia bacterium]
MKWYSYLICSILIVIGTFCTIELVDLFNVQSGEYGSVINYETQENYEEFSKFDYGTIEFDTEDYNTYKNITTFGAQQFDGTKENYTLFFNGQPLNNIVQTAGRINGDLSLKFYDLNGEEITTANIHFVIEYLASATKVTATITNTDNSVSYLNAYMEINGAVLQVVTKGDNL